VRLSSRNGRIDAGGKHNDRNYDIDYSPHVLRERVEENRYITYKGQTTESFEDVEKEFYKEHFMEHISAQNERNTKNRHKERNKTLDKYYRMKLSRPEDRIIQIGDKDAHISGDRLWDVALEYMERFNRLYGEHCKILTMAMHMDEATPHVHVRRVWLSRDKYGHECVNEKNALSDMGVFEPEPDKEVSRLNNAKITFTKTDRELLKSICQEKGIEIEKDVPGTLEHLPIRQYRERMAEAHTKELEERADELCESINQFFHEPAVYELFADELERISELDRREYRLALIKLYEKEVVNVIAAQDGDFINRVAQAQAEMETSQIVRYMKKNGLYDDYKAYREEKARSHIEKEPKELVREKNKKNTE